MHSIRFCLFAALLPHLAFAAPTRWWAQGDPSAEEQNALEWLNRSRADPVGTLNALIAASASDATLAASLAFRLPQTPGQLLAGLQLAYARALANSSAFPAAAAIDQAPLAFYPAFSQRAAELNAGAAVPPPQFPSGRGPPEFFPPVPAVGLLASGPDQAFSGPDATGGTAQFGPLGANSGEVTFANLYDPALGPREWMLAWLCAPGSGSPPPGFLLQGDALPNLTLAHTRLAGISIAGNAGGTRNLALFRASSEFLTLTDLPYGPLGTVFITGVAYRDQNGNSRYDPGEGLAGITLSLDHSDWGAVTATSGGYAIPVAANSGPFVVTAQAGGLAPLVATVMVGADSVKLDWPLPATPAALPVQVPVAGASGEGRLINLSTRGRIELGAAALIGGFIVSGPAGARETLLIRGVGPSLSTVGIPAAECVPATRLQLFSGAAPLAANAGWSSAADAGLGAELAAAKTGAFPLSRWAGGGGDSALVITVPPGAYSAVVTPAPGVPDAYASGHIGLVEIYEIAAAGGAQLANLSSRGLMGANDQALVIGATLAGAGAQRLVLRAAGPALAQIFGLAPVLFDPVLTLYDSAGAALLSNDDWSNSSQTEQIRTLGLASGAFPFPAGSADSGLIALLGPGQYSARLGAKPGTAPSGMALVEVYSAP